MFLESKKIIPIFAILKLTIMIKMIHSLWAYVVLIVLIAAIINAFMGLKSKREFN